MKNHKPSNRHLLGASVIDVIVVIVILIMIYALHFSQHGTVHNPTKADKNRPPAPLPTLQTNSANTSTESDANWRSVYQEKIPTKPNPAAFQKLKGILWLQKKLEKAEQVLTETNDNQNAITKPLKVELEKAHLRLYALSGHLKSVYGKLDKNQRVTAETDYADLIPLWYLGIGGSDPHTALEMSGDNTYHGPLEASIRESFLEVDYMSAFSVTKKDVEAINKDIDEQVKRLQY